MKLASILPFGMAMLASTASLAEPRWTAPGLHENVALTEHANQAATAELFARLQSALQWRHLQDVLAAKRQSLPDYTVDLAAEHFSVYVPKDLAPAHGYGLIVFIPPWREAQVPSDWRAALDDSGLVFVTAAQSGNEADPILRRAALALHAVAAMRKALPIDANRIYLAGFSGGARVALHVALAYPDLFRGALIDGSSDPFGSKLVPLPRMELLRRAQERLRLVYVFGGRDEFNAHSARRSAASAREHCLFDVTTMDMPSRGHERADPATWKRALAALEAPPSAARTDELSECRAKLDRALQEDIAGVQKTLVDKPADATKALEALDARWSQLAEPVLSELWHKAE